MKYYEIRAKCEVEKIVTVEAGNKEQAIKEFEQGYWQDEMEVEMINWKIIGKLKEM